MAFTFFGLIILAIVFSAIFGGYALVDYAIHGFNKCGPMCQLGGFFWGVVTVIILAAFYYECKDRQIFEKWLKKAIDPQGEIIRVQEKLRKREIRAAFWDSVRNKACFKMKLK